MAENQAELIERALEPFNRGDPEALREFIHPDFVLHDLDALPDAGTFRGFDGIRDWMEEIQERFETFKLESVSYEEVGDLLVADTIARGKGRSTGIEVETRFTVVWGVRDGKIAYHKGYAKREQALDDARAGG